MEVTSLREPKMADRVATVLRKMFIRGEIAEGTMLPPESELMERFGCPGRRCARRSECSNPNRSSKSSAASVAARA